MTPTPQPPALSVPPPATPPPPSGAGPHGGRVYVWGLAAGGALGLPPEAADRRGEVPVPTAVPKLRGVVQVACGCSCTAAVTASGQLYTWGSARCGRLGRVTPTPGHPGCVDALKDCRVLQVACGQGHMACLVEGGQVYSWGKGTHGQLGNGGADSPLPVTVSLPGGVPLPPAVQVACGDDTTAALLATGELYVWGNNSHGQLGLGDLQGRRWPMLLRGAPPFTMVSLGSLYSGAVTREGEVFMWGYGGGGNLGTGRRASALSPTPVAFPAAARMASVHCTVGQPNPQGGAAVDGTAKEGVENPHTFSVGIDGSLWSWGTAHKGVLGNCRRKVGVADSGKDELLPYRVGSVGRDTPSEGPTHYLHGQRITQAAAASIHSAARAADGTLYTWGCGSGGRTGQRAYMEGLSGGRQPMKCYLQQPLPLDALAGRQVLQVAAHRYHMAAVVAEPPL